MIYSLSLLLVFKFLHFCKIETTVFRFDVIGVIGSKVNPRVYNYRKLYNYMRVIVQR